MSPDFDGKFATRTNVRLIDGPEFSPKDADRGYEPQNNGDSAMNGTLARIILALLVGGP